MKFGQYMRMIDDTHISHLSGELNEIEYINAYNEILDTVMDSKSISDFEKRELVSIIRQKIGQIPKVEEIKQENKNRELQEKELAFKDAKNRFRKLSIFQRIKLNLKGQSPEQVHKSLGSLEEINNLYKR